MDDGVRLGEVGERHRAPLRLLRGRSSLNFV
jgi:hypothetical protein